MFLNGRCLRRSPFCTRNDCSFRLTLSTINLNDFDRIFSSNNIHFFLCMFILEMLRLNSNAVWLLFFVCFLLSVFRFRGVHRCCEEQVVDYRLAGDEYDSTGGVASALSSSGSESVDSPSSPPVPLIKTLASPASKPLPVDPLHFVKTPVPPLCKQVHTESDY